MHPWRVANASPRPLHGTPRATRAIVILLRLFSRSFQFHVSRVQNKLLILIRIQISTAGICIMRRRRTRGERTMIARPLFISAVLIFFHSKDATNELNKKGDLSKLQLDAVAYLWELCYDLLLGKSDNVSTSPGFEALGLRVNSERKRKRDE